MRYCPSHQRAWVVPGALSGGRIAPGYWHPLPAYAVWWAGVVAAAYPQSVQMREVACDRCERGEDVARLTAAQRKKLPASEFALGKGHYPINDQAHARAALSRASANASPAEQATIRKKVAQKYPEMEISGGQHMPRRAPEERASKAKNHY